MATLQRKNGKRLTKQQLAEAAAALDSPTSPVTATKAVRKANRQSLSAEDIATIVAQTVATEMERRDKLASRIPGQRTAPVNKPIPAALQAAVDAGYLKLEEAQATANGLSMEQQASADHIPQSQAVAPIVHEHKPAGIAYGKDKVTGKQYHFFGFPLLTRNATGNDYQDRDGIGYHACKSLLDEAVRQQMIAYCDFWESEQVAKGRYKTR